VVVTPVSDVPFSAIPIHENVPVLPSDTGSLDELLGTLPLKERRRVLSAGGGRERASTDRLVPPIVRAGVVVAVAKASLVDGPDTPWNPT